MVLNMRVGGDMPCLIMLSYCWICVCNCWAVFSCVLTASAYSYIC